MNEYVSLSFAACLPMVAALIIYILDQKHRLGKEHSLRRYAAIGMVFGALAICGTEFGIPIDGAQVNCRDAAVLTAGLMFGGPAGIIAGLIGGIERWFAVYWGIGTFTRTACTISTILAGFFAALLRKYMFEGRKPGWLMAFAIGIVVEVFHLTMVFVTNMDDTEKAMDVIQSCSFPMIIANGLSVLLAAIAVTFAAKENFFYRKNETIRISARIQKYLLITVALAFAATSAFVFELQDEMSKSQTDSVLSIANDEAYRNIKDASDETLLGIAHAVARELEDEGLKNTLEKNGLAEINVIDSSGIIVDSSEESYLGFDMNKGGQSLEFMKNIKRTGEYVQQYGSISNDDRVKRKYAGVTYGEGFLQVGYTASQIEESIHQEVVGATGNSRVGVTGYILIMNEKLDIVSAPKEMKKIMSEEEKKAVRGSQEGKTFWCMVNGISAYCQILSAEGYYIMSVLPVEEALKGRNIAVYVNSFMEILIFAVLFFVIYMLISRIVVNQIKSVNSSLRRITKGDLSETVNVRSSEEFASLSDDINSTVDTLKEYIAQASARIDEELEFARNIQKSALPKTDKTYINRKDFDICATMNAAKEVGGDFYDFYMTEDEVLHFLIADVSGKGIPAAMFMMRAKTELKTLTEAGYRLDLAFTEGNNALCEGNDTGMFVTAWQGNINLENGTIQFANAGHNPPAIQRPDGIFEYMEIKPGFILAGMEDMKYKVQEDRLVPSSVIFLYTDGVTEATNGKNELYGEKRLLGVLNAKKYETMEELCRMVKEDVDAFVGGAPQFDDITMLALRYLGKPEIIIEKAGLEDIGRITDFIEERVSAMGGTMADIAAINVAIDEIVSNILNYGYSGGKGLVAVRLSEKMNPDRVDITFIDEGVPYNPLKKDDPDTTLSAEEREVGGLGIFIVKMTMDDMKYRYENDRNILTITKIFKKGK